MELWDTHLHTSFSGDCEVSPSEMISAARERGLSGIIITDHLDWDYFKSPGMFDLDIPEYINTIGTLRKESQNTDFKIGMGIELGLQEHLSAKHEALLKEYDFDQVIGSIHQVDEMDPYYEDFYKGRDIYDAYEDYLSAAIVNLSLFPKIDTLGHLDYASRYGIRYFGKEKGALRYEDHRASIDKILMFLIESDICLEVNTGAFRSGMDEPNPSYRILSRYYEMGGRAITLGGDAHHTEHIALEFENVIKCLKEIGFKEYRIYRSRKPITLPL
ncbi:MAG: histidinol-phosphatase HisJ family protein [Lachnospiraceae bacterium]|nr:histidinol-phosphatase HisJ family protein [Lachnospiraceae bacterium]